jgi:hypothetical protein
MAKGEIIVHEGGGLYRVRLKYAIEQVESELLRVNSSIAELAVELPSKKVEVLQAQDEVDDIVRDINLLIPDYSADVIANTDKMTRLQADLIKRQSSLSRLKYALELLIAENLDLLKRRGILEAIPEDKDLNAWCADYTRNLQGEIGLIDINDEGGQGVLIQPGYEDAAVYSADRDGSLTPRAAQTPAQVYFNSAILPGVQKWRPRYRVGSISNLVSDTCALTLDDAFSSAQTLPINQVSQFSGVPIVYMSCNGSAFEDGDRVLVRMTKSGPLVVGFESEPRACNVSGIIFVPGRLDLSNVMQDSFDHTVGADRTDYGQPYLDVNDDPINYPLGTEGGDSPAWTIVQGNGDFEVQRGQQKNYGTANWVGKEGEVLSWGAPPGRMHDYFGPRSGRAFLDGLKASWDDDSKIYYKQKAIDLGVGNIAGSAFMTDFSGQEWLCAATDNDEIYRVRVDAEKEVVGDVELITSYEKPETTDTFRLSAVSGWYFSESGDRAVRTFRTDDPSEQVDKSNGQVHVLRFDGASITSEMVFDTNEDAGTEEDYVIKTRSGDPAPEATITFYEELKYTRIINSYTQPLYYDYKGDIEICLFLEHPGETLEDKIITTGSVYYGGQENNLFIKKESTNVKIITSYFSGPKKILTSDGRVIAEFPETKNNSYKNTSVIREGQDYIRLASGDIKSNSSDFNLICVDARYGSCLARVSEYSENTVSSGDPYPADEPLGHWSIDANRNISSDTSVFIISNGAKVSGKVIESESINDLSLIELSTFLNGRTSFAPAETPRIQKQPT